MPQTARGKKAPRYNFIWDALQRIRFEVDLAGQLMEGFDELALLDAADTRLAACLSLVSSLVSQVATRLRPDLFAEVPLPARALYDDALLPPEVREQVRFMLADLLKFDAGTIHCCGQDEAEQQAVSIRLVETAIYEIGHHVLDKPIVYAPAVTRALHLISAYLRGFATKEFSDKTVARAAQDILFLIVWETSPHYLAAHRREGGATLPPIRNEEATR